MYQSPLRKKKERTYSENYQRLINSKIEKYSLEYQKNKCNARKALKWRPSISNLIQMEIDFCSSEKKKKTNLKLQINMYQTPKKEVPINHSKKNLEATNLDIAEKKRGTNCLTQDDLGENKLEAIDILNFSELRQSNKKAHAFRPKWEKGMVCESFFSQITPFNLPISKIDSASGNVNSTKINSNFKNETLSEMDSNLFETKDFKASNANNKMDSILFRIGSPCKNIEAIKNKNNISGIVLKSFPETTLGIQKVEGEKNDAFDWISSESHRNNQLCMTCIFKEEAKGLTPSLGKKLISNRELFEDNHSKNNCKNMTSCPQCFFSNKSKVNTTTFFDEDFFIGKKGRFTSTKPLIFNNVDMKQIKINLNDFRAI